MPARRSCVLLVCWLVTGLSGCALMDTGAEISRSTWRVFRPRSSDYRDVTEEDDADQWSFVGSEGRASRERDTDPDRWWQDHVMSSKARSIERNVGID